MLVCSRGSRLREISWDVVDKSVKPCLEVQSNSEAANVMYIGKLNVVCAWTVSKCHLLPPSAVSSKFLGCLEVMLMVVHLPPDSSECCVQPGCP